MDSGALSHPTVRVWESFDEEDEQRTRVSILCGVPTHLVDDVMYLATARSRPAGRLVARTPDIMRHLAHRTVTHTERCVGHVRGPIQWSETITAWSSGIGVDDVFVCVTPRRDFDVAENRLLAWLLTRLVVAGRRSRGDAARLLAPDELDRVRAHATAAQRFLAHKVLRGVSSQKLTGREFRDIRKSRHLATYSPAVKLAERVRRPLLSTEARTLVSQSTIEHHRVMMMLMDSQRALGLAVPKLAIRGDFAVSGLLRYRNPSIMVDRRLSAESGLFFGTTRVLTASDTAGSGSSGAEPAYVVSTQAEADELVTTELRARRARSQGLSDTSTQSASGFVQLPGSYSS